MNQDPNSRRPGDDGTGSGADAGSARETASRIWLAGLGALARAQAEGSKLFENLIKEGQGLQGRGPQPPPEARASEEAADRSGGTHDAPGSRGPQDAFGSRFGDAGKRLADLAAGLSQRTADSWDRLEGAFEERLARGLSRLGVPTREDMEDLRARVADLEDEVDRLRDLQSTSARTPGQPSGDGRTTPSD